MCPLWAAPINAVQPVLSLGTMFGSARWPNRSLTMARNPYEEANIKAVRPSALVAFTSAPASVSAEMVSACPSAAAIINGVQPPLIGLFTLTFSSISFLIKSVLPAEAAKYGRDKPDFSTFSLRSLMLLSQRSPRSSGGQAPATIWQIMLAMTGAFCSSLPCCLNSSMYTGMQAAQSSESRDGLGVCARPGGGATHPTEQTNAANSATCPMEPPSGESCSEDLPVSGLHVHHRRPWIDLVIRRLAAQPDSARFGAARLLHSDQAQPLATGRVGALGNDVHVPLAKPGHRPSQRLVQEGAAEHGKETGPGRLVGAVINWGPAAIEQKQVVTGK